MTVGSDSEMIPRRPLVSVGYAFRSERADTADYALVGAADNDWTILGDTIYHLSGNVGIGMASPTEKLDVTGNIHASGTIRSGNSITVDGVNDKITATSGKIDFDDEDLVTKGKVGIGTTSPDDKLDVNGDFQLSAGDPDIAATGGSRLYINYSSGDAGVVQFGGINTCDIYVDGDIDKLGTCSDVMQTQTYGYRKHYADESTEVYHFDRGQGQLQNGETIVALDPVFLETVTISDEYPALVQITLTADCQGVYVDEQTPTYFKVKELMGGKSDATFNWELAAKRRGYESVRLEDVTELVEESRAKVDQEDIE